MIQRSARGFDFDSLLRCDLRRDNQTLHQRLFLNRISGALKRLLSGGAYVDSAFLNDPSDGGANVHEALSHWLVIGQSFSYSHGVTGLPPGGIHQVVAISPA